MVFRLSPKTCSTVRLQDFPLFAANSYKVPNVLTDEDELSLFMMLSVIKLRNLTDSVILCTLTTLKPSFTLVFSRAEATSLSDVALAPVRCP
jgi:hypothetical protein